jgi:hypothetical protein
LIFGFSHRFASSTKEKLPMRRKIHRFPHSASSPVLRRVFRPLLNRLEDRTLLATMLWTNAAGGDWDVASNWVNATNHSDQQLPSATDDVVIEIAGAVVHTSESVTVNNLTLSGASLDLGGSLAVNGLLTLSPGEASTAPATTLAGSETVDAFGGMSISGNLQLTGVTLNNYAPATWDFNNVVNSTDINLYSGATFNNKAGASFTAEGADQASGAVEAWTGADAFR